MCGGAPDAPDLGPSAEASKYAADLAYKTAAEQREWSMEQWDRQEKLLDEVLGSQARIASEQWEAGKKDRERYERVFQGREDDLVEESQEYDSPERRELERGRAQAQVQQAFESQRQNALARLESYGIDPSQTRSAAMDTNARVSMAAQQAAAANRSDSLVEAQGRALRTEALNIGKGYPGQSMAAYQGALAANNSMVSNMNTTVGSGASHLGTAQSWQGQGLQATQQHANILNSGFQNELQAFNAKQAASPMAAIGDIAGTALGVAGSFGMQEGGSVPEDMAPAPGPQDKFPAMLAEDEYVVPADVVKWKGVEFFEKLQKKSREDQSGGKEQGVPA